MNPYTTTYGHPYGAFNDRVKAYFITSAFKMNTGDNITTIQYNMNCQNFGVTTHPFGTVVSNANDDMRLSNCGAVTVDVNNGMIFDFMITNEGVWAYYERLNYLRNATYVYRAFTQVKKIHTRTSVNEFHDLKLIYNPTTKVMEYLHNGVVGLTISSIGRGSTDPGCVTVWDLGGTEEDIVITQLQTGFALFTFLDTIDNLNSAATKGLVQLHDAIGPLFTYVIPVTFFDNASLTANRIFGQGATMKIVSHTVTQVDSQTSAPSSGSIPFVHFLVGLGASLVLLFL